MKIDWVGVKLTTLYGSCLLGYSFAILVIILGLINILHPIGPIEIIIGAVILYVSDWLSKEALKLPGPGDRFDPPGAF